MLSKKEFRLAIRTRRKQLEPLFIQQASLQIANQLVQLPEIQNAKHIAFYLSQEGEVDPQLIVNHASLQNKYFYLPVITSKNEKKLLFYPYEKKEKLQSNSLGILEPSTVGKEAIPLQNLDIVFVPLVGFDHHCNRVGRGAGYYDQTFAFIKNNSAHNPKPLLIGLAYNFQKTAELSVEPWDVPLHMIATETELYKNHSKNVNTRML